MMVKGLPVWIILRRWKNRYPNCGLLYVYHSGGVGPGSGDNRVFHPGVGFQFTEGSAEAVEIAELPTMVSSSRYVFQQYFATFNNANMMQVLIIAVIMGVAIVMLLEERGRLCATGLSVWRTW